MLYLNVCSLSYATSYALVIGIGSYPKENGWNKINGDKDIPYVKEMLFSNGFEERNIKVLKNEKATASAITSEIENIIKTVTKDDVVYIHFSGHGQQITDINGDEEEGFDEAWVPYDAHMTYKKDLYEGDKHIIDDQLNKWLTQLRSKVGKNGKITVVADACHSGDGTRGNEENSKYTVRGTSGKFIIPNVQNKFLNKYDNVDWIYISACKPDQSNYEYQRMGSLTYALYNIGANLSNLSCDVVHRNICTTINEIINRVQTPTLEKPTVSEQNNLF